MRDAAFESGSRGANDGLVREAWHGGQRHRAQAQAQGVRK